VQKLIPEPTKMALLGSWGIFHGFLKAIEKIQLQLPTTKHLPANIKKPRKNTTNAPKKRPLRPNSKQLQKQKQLNTRYILISKAF